MRISKLSPVGACVAITRKANEPTPLIVPRPWNSARPALRTSQSKSVALKSIDASVSWNRKLPVGIWEIRNLLHDELDERA